MKIRSGLVSNSSSSSFLMMGEYFETSWQDEKRDSKKFLEQMGLDASGLDGSDGYEVYERVEQALVNAGFDVYMDECGMYYGIIVLYDYGTISSDELINELKDAKKRAKKLNISDTVKVVYTSG